MRGGHVFVVLLASALAIEDDERDALGAPGPTRANLRGRGLKFGHSVTEVEEEATDPPAPAPTFAATDPPVPAPTAPAGISHGDFAAMESKKERSKPPGASAAKGKSWRKPHSSNGGRCLGRTRRRVATRSSTTRPSRRHA